MRNLLLVLVVLMITAQGASADDAGTGQTSDSAQTESKPAGEDPNRLWWAKWDVVVKDPNDPNQVLPAKWSAVMAVLKSEELDQETKAKIISNVVTPIFDFPLMAKLALGRTHWPKLTAPQREKYTRLFIKRLKKSYQEKIAFYKDEEIFFKPAVPKGKTLHVPTELVSGDEKVAILYKLRKVDKRWKIYDVDIQGVSILLTYRSQFDDILRRSTVEDLLSRLAKPQSQ